MVESHVVSVTPAIHAGNHVIGGSDPLVDPLFLHASRHEAGGADVVDIKIYDPTGTDVLCEDTVNASTAGGAYAKEHEIILHVSPDTLNIRFGLWKNVAAGSDAYGRIYRNGVAVGTERHTGATTIQYYTEEIAGWSSGDLLQLYTKGDGVNFNQQSQYLGIIGTFKDYIVPEVV